MGMEKRAWSLPRGTRVKMVNALTGEASEGVFIGPEDRRDFVIVPLAEMRHSATTGDGLTIRYGSAEAMIEFASEIVEVIDKPVLMWRLRVPTAVNSYELRGHKRIQCSIAARIEAVGKGLILTGIVRDISKQGARCAVQLRDGGDHPLAVDDNISLRCTFPGLPGEQVAAGCIVEVAQTEGDLTIGIRFHDTQGWVPPYH